MSARWHSCLIPLRKMHVISGTSRFFFIHSAGDDVPCMAALSDKDAFAQRHVSSVSLKSVSLSLASTTLRASDSRNP